MFGRLLLPPSPKGRSVRLSVANQFGDTSRRSEANCVMSTDAIIQIYQAAGMKTKQKRQNYSLYILIITNYNLLFSLHQNMISKFFIFFETART